MLLVRRAAARPFGPTVKIVVARICAVVIATAFWFADNYVAPLFLNSRIERIHEGNLPRITIESGNTAYCRMKADDFRFSLPRGSHAEHPVISGGFDAVDGSVEARFEGTNLVTASEYESFLSGSVQVGGQVTARTTPGGLLIKFHYFGDR